jgi:hypothetical protein
MAVHNPAQLGSAFSVRREAEHTEQATASTFHRLDPIAMMAA